MPALDATTTATFAAIGVNPATVYTAFTGLVGTSVSFGLWLIQLSWPFLLGVGFLYLVWRLTSKFASFGR
jgi:hypothetical protein